MVILTILAVSAISQGTDCPDLARKQPTVSTREVGCVSSVSFAHVKSANADTGKLLYSWCSTLSGEDVSLCVGPRTVPDANYTPFVSVGFVSLVGDSHRVPVKILRDTGASESFIHQAVLSSASDTDSAVLIQGIGLH